MYRRRQVRQRYPRAFVDLAIALAARHGRRRSAGALGLPLSTVYRWLDRHDPSGPPVAAMPAAEHFDALVAACEAHGFDLRRRVAALEPGVPRTATTGAATQAHGAHDGAAPAPAALLGEPGAHEVRAMRERDDGPAPPRGAVSPNVAARIRLARLEIDRRYYAPLSCEQLAAIAGMSRFHFIRTFKQACGVAPYRYLMQVRVRHARHLLSTTPQPLDAIAAAVGYDSTSLLCKAFRSVEGVSLATAFAGVRLGARPPQPAPAHAAL